MIGQNEMGGNEIWSQMRGAPLSKAQVRLAKVRRPNYDWPKLMDPSVLGSEIFGPKGMQAKNIGLTLFGVRRGHYGPDDHEKLWCFYRIRARPPKNLDLDPFYV